MMNAMEEAAAQVSQRREELQVLKMLRGGAGQTPSDSRLDALKALKSDTTPEANTPADTHTAVAEPMEMVLPPASPPPVHATTPAPSTPACRAKYLREEDKEQITDDVMKAPLTEVRTALKSRALEMTGPAHVLRLRLAEAMITSGQTEFMAPEAPRTPARKTSVVFGSGLTPPPELRAPGTPASATRHATPAVENAEPVSDTQMETTEESDAEEEPLAKAAAKPAAKAAAKPAAKKANRKPAGKPAAKAAPKPAGKKAAPKPAAKPAPKPAAKAAAKPAPKPAPKPAVKAAAKPAPKPAVKAAPKPAPKLATVAPKPAGKKAAPKPASKAAPKPAAKKGQKRAASEEPPAKRARN